MTSMSLVLTDTTE